MWLSMRRWNTASRIASMIVQCYVISKQVKLNKWGQAGDFLAVIREDEMHVQGAGGAKEMY